MKRLLQELEARLRELPPPQRAELAGAFIALSKAVGASSTAFKGLFRPTRMALLGMFTDLSLALSGGPNLVAKAKKLAPTIGPHVTALVQAL